MMKTKFGKPRYNGLHLATHAVLIDWKNDTNGVKIGSFFTLQMRRLRLALSLFKKIAYFLSVRKGSILLLYQ